MFVNPITLILIENSKKYNLGNQLNKVLIKTKKNLQQN